MNITNKNSDIKSIVPMYPDAEKYAFARLGNVKNAPSTKSAFFLGENDESVKNMRYAEKSTHKSAVNFHAVPSVKTFSTEPSI